MIFFRCSILICNLLLVSLLTSAFAVASVNKVTHSHLSDAGETQLATTTLVVTGQLCDESEVISKSQQAWHDRLEATDSDSKAAQQSCPLQTAPALFPATTATQLQRVQVASLALISRKQSEKTHSFTELLYRPPIG